MELENVLYEVKDGILYLTLNRPDVRNALSPGMWRDIQAGVQRAGSDPEVKVVIISGRGGKALASGADIREIHDRDYMKQMDGTATLSLKMVEDLYKPTICAVNGYALGGGCELAMACDIRVATRRSKFGQPETGLGIMPGAGGTQRLARIVGVSNAMELILTAKTIGAAEAKAIGLVSEVCPPEELMPKALEMAEAICANAQIAVCESKRCIRKGMQTDIYTGSALEAEAFGVTCGTEDKDEGMGAFLEKRQEKHFQNK